MRLLVTGSRDWQDEGRLIEILDLFLVPRLVVVHGACPDGVDKMADRWAIERGLRPDRHPAQWSEGRGAAFVRNQRMVDLGADLCLAFARRCRKQGCRNPEVHGSHGTTDTTRRAKRAGIVVIDIREDW